MIDSIPGMFGFQGHYEAVAEEAPPGSVLVELGVFCGKSIAFLAERTRAKRCRLFGVDTFLGSPEFHTLGLNMNGRPWGELPVGVCAMLAVGDLAEAKALGDVTLIVSDSAKAAKLFPDESIFSVFIDAAHDADSVERDIRAWWPKLQPGGVMAGDDMSETFRGVREAVVRVFGDASLPPTPPAGQTIIWSVRK